MLFQCPREVVYAGFGIQDIVIVVRILGLQGSFDAAEAWVGDGSRGQAGVRVGVVGAVYLQVLCRQVGFSIESIDHGGIDVQVGGGAVPGEETVVDDGSNGIALIGAGGFLLNEGSHSDHVRHGELVGADIVIAPAILTHHVADVGVQLRQLFPEAVVYPLVEVAQQFAQNIGRGVVGVELVGVGEEVALQAVLVPTGKAF